MKTTPLLLIPALCLALAGCSQMRPTVRPEEARETRAETCRHSCDRESAICGDKATNQMESPREAWADAGLGANAVCGNALRDCLKRCPKQ